MVLYIVVPCYNEEDVITETAKRLKAKIGELVGKGKISGKSRIVFVNDGSKDKTWEIIQNLHGGDPCFSGINMAANAGHQNAVMAGLMTVKGCCDAAVTMDADLQDDVNALDEMVEKHIEGCDVVYGVRSSRGKDPFFKRFTAEGFYRFMRSMGANVVFNHADYRLMSKRVLESLSGFKEVNLFLRGIIPLIGFKSGTVYYERGERYAGESKYPFSKMLAFAINGITSFSVKPLRIITVIGLFMIIFSLLAFLYILLSLILGHNWLQRGWASTMSSIWLIGGIQTFSIGVIGEYIGKIYFETKSRPRYIIESFINDG
jgi:glycosyltransferase involved in cell wall biosynthesis